ncbi:creatininase family protein [Nitratireductor sp. GCM10026969]|uniref:creatininase family protein n=1 Tax=Nitratireductor sp. GCM10026969 TaxID=3252645 RepID=UPI0036122560
MKWEELTTQEIEAIDRQTVVVLPIAAVEQHGAHLPLSTDCTIGMHLLETAERRCGADILILPQIKVCCSDHHMDFPGTLSVRHETFLAYAEDILRSVMAHGFTTILVFNSHGGNQAIARVLVDKLGNENRHCRIALLTWWTLAAPELAAVRESGPGGINHACEFETALMLHAAPGTVRTDLIGGMSIAPTADWAEEDMLKPARGTLFRTMKEKSGGSGTVGDPSLASEAKGAAITAAVVDALERVISDLRRMPRG